MTSEKNWDELVQVLGDMAQCGSSHSGHWALSGVPSGSLSLK